MAPLLETARSRRGLATVAIDAEDAYSAWLAAAAVTSAEAAGEADRVVLQIYTSGTTGRPKGAMLTNRNATKWCDLDQDVYPAWWRVHADDTSLVALPLFHVGGLEAAFRVLFSGGRIILHREFDAAEVLASIGRYRPTLVSLVPTALHAVLRARGAEEVDFTCIRTFFYGASPIPLELLREALAVMRCDFVQCYGLSEASSTVVALPPEDHDPAGAPRMRSAGKPLPKVELKIIDQQGGEAGPGAVGEVLIRAPFVMKGYWRNDAATATAIDDDGWLHTGDAGYLDEAGYLFIHDRVKDMIISGGENIYPAEVESAVFGHPLIEEVAVIGVPDPVWGEAVKAVVVLRPGAVLDEAEVIAWTRQRIAAYKAPRSIDVIDALPKNATGKLLKTELRKPYWQGTTRAVN